MAAKYASTTALGAATAADEAGGVGVPPESPRDVSASAVRPATTRTATSVPTTSAVPSPWRRRRRGGGGSGRHSSGAVTLGTCPASARFRAGSLRNKWSRKSSGGGLSGGSPEPAGDRGLGAHGESPGPAGGSGLGSPKETPGPAGGPGLGSRGNTPGSVAGAPVPAEDSGLGLGMGTPASADRPGSGRPAGSRALRTSTGVVGDHPTGIGTGGSGAGRSAPGTCRAAGSGAGGSRAGGTVASAGAAGTGLAYPTSVWATGGGSQSAAESIVPTSLRSWSVVGRHRGSLARHHSTRGRIRPGSWRVSGRSWTTR